MQVWLARQLLSLQVFWKVNGGESADTTENGHNTKAQAQNSISENTLDQRPQNAWSGGGGGGGRGVERERVGSRTPGGYGGMLLRKIGEIWVS